MLKPLESETVEYTSEKSLWSQENQNLLKGLNNLQNRLGGTLKTVVLIEKISGKETSLIMHLVKEANQPGYHTADDKYLRVTIGNTDYIAELKSGNVIEQNRAGNRSGGFSGAYAEVSLNLLNKNKQETAQGASQILKLTESSWKRIALSEGDYQCADVKSIPKAALKALKVECN